MKFNNIFLLDIRDTKNENWLTDLYSLFGINEPPREESTAATPPALMKLLIQQAVEHTEGLSLFADKPCWEFVADHLGILEECCLENKEGFAEFAETNPEIFNALKDDTIKHIGIVCLDAMTFMMTEAGKLIEAHKQNSFTELLENETDKIYVAEMNMLQYAADNASAFFEYVTGEANESAMPSDGHVIRIEIPMETFGLKKAVRGDREIDTSFINQLFEKPGKREFLTVSTSGPEMVSLGAADEAEDEIEFKKALTEFIKKYPSPEDIKSYLDGYVHKQDEAKWYVSQLLFEKVSHHLNNDDIPKTNMMMIGPTGCGKTYIWEKLQEISPVPIAIVESTQITKQGFKGKDKEDVFSDIYFEYPDIERGFVVFDEFDKLCEPMHESHGDDVNRQIQGDLLKTIEGTVLSVDGIYIDTSDITFVCAGAFTDMYQKITAVPNPFGFNSTEQKAGRIDIVKELIDYGMIPEMAGRLNSIVFLSPLNEKDYHTILTKTKDNSLVHIKKIFKSYYGVDLVVTDDALRTVAQIAYELKLGARGMAGIIERTCRKNLHKVRAAGKKRMRVTAEMITGAQYNGPCGE